MRSSETSDIAKQLKQNRLLQVGEILGIFTIPGIILWGTQSLYRDDPILTQAVLWIVNILMIIYVGTGIRLRGDDWSSIGLSFRMPGWKQGGKIFLRSLLVFVISLAAYLAGSMIMINISGMPEQADLSTYDFLKGNPLLFIVTLLGIYVASSFGEEVVYRGFLITRLEKLLGASRWATTISVLTSAVIFGFIHFSWGPTGIVQTAFLGLALAVCFVRFRRNLWLMVWTHVIMDSLLWIQIFMSG